MPSQSLPIEAGCVDFGSPSLSLLLPQEGLKLTLGLPGLETFPTQSCSGRLWQAAALAEEARRAWMGGGTPSPDVLVPGPHWLRPGLGDIRTE